MFCSLLVLSACSTPDCSEADTPYVKYEYDSEAKKCVVVKSIQRNKCGNGIIEDGEDYCSCSQDVEKDNPALGCEGEIGEYLKKACSEEKECVVQPNEKVVVQTKDIELKNSDVVVASSFKLANPFVLNTEPEGKVRIDLEYLKPSTSAPITDLKAKKLQILNSRSIVLAEVNYDQTFMGVGDSVDPVTVTLSDTTEYESRESLKVKLTVEYLKDGSPKVESLTGSIGTLTIINPNFYEDE